MDKQNAVYLHKTAFSQERERSTDNTFWTSEATGSENAKGRILSPWNVRKVNTMDPGLGLKTGRDWKWTGGFLPWRWKVLKPAVTPVQHEFTQAPDHLLNKKDGGRSTVAWSWMGAGGLFTVMEVFVLGIFLKWIKRCIYNGWICCGIHTS